MKSRDADVRRLDVRAFAKRAGQCQGEWPLDNFERLRDLLMLPEAPAQAPGVAWTLRGEERPVRAGPAEVWLHVSASACLPMACQRCLQRCEHLLTIDRHIQFVADEATAAALDNEAEHDVLVVARELDLHELLEDELLLDLPLVPRHEVCPQPLGAAYSAEPESEPAQAHPFAALAALRRTNN